MGQFLNDHILASTNDRRLVLVSNIKFWNEISEKIYEIFFWAQKSHFLAKRGPFWVPVTPSTMKFEILTLPYHFHIKFMLESTKKTLGIDLYEGAIDFQSFYYWSFLAKTPETAKICPGMTISWHLQMIEAWFWYQKSSLGMNFLKKYMQFFFAQKMHFLAKRGPFWVPVTPITMKFEILTLPYHFHIKFMLE